MAGLKFHFLMVLLLLVLCLSIAPTVFAQTPESFGLIPQETLPGSPDYNLKRMKEKISGFFKFSKKAKINYRRDLLERRVSEYVSLIENKNQLDIANSSQRIAYEAGILTNISESESIDTKMGVVELFEKYKPILAKMRDNFPANSPSWLLSQQDVDTFNILSDRLK